MDDLESIITRAMEAHQKLQDAHMQRAATVSPRELDRKQMTIDEAINQTRCIPTRFRPIVKTILQDGVPASLSTLALALDVDVSAAVVRKMALNESRYPIDKARGSSEKYTAYE